MSVAIADLDREALETAGAGLAGAGVDALAVPCDVRVEDDVAQLAVAVVERFGTAHVVCNNAGVAPFGGVTEMTVAEYRWVLDVNFFGVLHGVRSFLPILEDQGEGHIVNTASVSGLITQPGGSAYNASKFAVVALSEALYYELQIRDSPVGVSVVCPATVRTGIFDPSRRRPPGVEPSVGPIATRATQVMERLAASSHRSPDDVAERVVAAVLASDFYVLTHPGIMRFVERRNEDIEMQRNPSVEQGF
jgi:NAD(P)-dependent dehydrogenase (short-subunit alcohol dehydrogenase family)